MGGLDSLLHAQLPLHCCLGRRCCHTHAYTPPAPFDSRGRLGQRQRPAGRAGRVLQWPGPAPAAPEPAPGAATAGSATIEEERRSWPQQARLSGPKRRRRWQRQCQLHCRTPGKQRCSPLVPKMVATYSPASPAPPALTNAVATVRTHCMAIEQGISRGTWLLESRFGLKPCKKCGEADLKDS